MGTTNPTVFVRSPIFPLNSCYPLGLKLCISRKAIELHTNLPLPVGTTISTTRYYHFANQNGRQVNSEIFSLVPHPKLRPFRKYSYTSSILTSSGLYLFKPSLSQCHKVISKLKENNHWVTLRKSSSYVVRYLLPRLLKIRTITYISIYSTKVTKDNIISSQLSNNTSLQYLDIVDGCIDDDGVVTLVQSLKYNKSITGLSLDKNPEITSASAQSLAELLLNNNTLKYFSLEETNIDANGVLVLLESLKTNKRLRRLWLDKQHEQTCYSLPYYQAIIDRLHFK